MYPTMFAFGSFSLSSFGVCMALAFVLFTFLLWKNVRNEGVTDEKIFDNVLTVTLFLFIFARLFFVSTHWGIFSPNLLRSFLVWKYPGLSFWGALIGGVGTLYIVGRKQGLRAMSLFDTYALTLSPALFFVALGIFLDGSVRGKETNLIIGVPQIGDTHKYHAVGFYGLILTILFAVLILFLRRIQIQKKLGPGFLGWVALSLLGFGQLLLAFFRADILYWGGFSVDYIIATILLVGPWGPIYKEIDGTKLIKRSLVILKSKGEKFYAYVSKTRPHRN